MASGYLSQEAIELLVASVFLLPDAASSHRPPTTVVSAWLHTMIRCAFMSHVCCLMVEGTVHALWSSSCPLTCVNSGQVGGTRLVIDASVVAVCRRWDARRSGYGSCSSAATTVRIAAALVLIFNWEHSERPPSHSTLVHRSAVRVCDARGRSVRRLFLSTYSRSRGLPHDSISCTRNSTDIGTVDPGFLVVPT